jgi:uncharacterized protein (DUF2252 family)
MGLAPAGCWTPAGDGTWELSLGHPCRCARASSPVSTDDFRRGRPVLARSRAARSIAAKRAARQTFSEVAAQYIAQHAKSWKSKKHGAQWKATLEAYAYPVVGSLSVRRSLQRM